MQYSDTTNRNGVIQEIERLTDLGIGYISGDATRLKDFTAMVNKNNRKIWHLIFISTGNWQYDDSNNTNLPIATTDIDTGTSQYALPTELLTIQRLEIKDENDNWYRLNALQDKNIPGAIDEFNDTDGTPLYYTVLNGTIELYPGPNYDKTDGLKVYFDRDAVDFATSDTTKTPGFASPYHELLPIKTAIEWYKIKQPASPSLQVMIQDELRMEKALNEFYSRRLKDYVPRIRREYKSYR